MAHVLACPRYPAIKLAHILPVKFFEQLEQNQLIASCCRHPENHEIEAWYSSEEQAETEVPDIYIMHCTCGRQHRRFCVGGSHGSGSTTPEFRPVWEVR